MGHLEDEVSGVLTWRQMKAAMMIYLAAARHTNA